MNNRACVAALMLCLASPCAAETLREAIAAAYAGNPQLAEARARQDALAETPNQAQALGRLTADLSGAGGYSRFDNGTGGTGAITANLPVWTGGRVPAAVRAATQDAAAGAEAVRDTEAAVLETVVAAYAELLYAQQAVAVAEADIELLAQQVAEARSRFQLGQAARTDVAQFEAQLESARADLAVAESETAAIAAVYRATIGADPGRLEATPPPPAALPGTVAAARANALAANPVVRRQRLATTAAAARIDRERAEGNPNLGIGASYGYAVNDRLAASPNVASANLVLRLPLLTGGLVAARVRAARADYRAAGFATIAAEREAVRLAETAWANLIAAQARAEANARRVAAAELALNGVRAEYGFSLRTTLDILIANGSLRAAQLALARSRSDILIQQAALLRATGLLGPDSY